MTPGVVVDVGNTRIKWGLVSPQGTEVCADAGLPDEPAAWQQQLSAWQAAGLLTPGPTQWVLTSVVPARCARLSQWLSEAGHAVLQLERAAQLPLKTEVFNADHVGIDRLLDAAAAKSRLSPGEPAVVVDAGSAVTVDWLDEQHVFRGGAIYPGFRLMSMALHTWTALLPEVRVSSPVPAWPAPHTPLAMQTGIFHAVAGGIEKIVREVRSARRPRLFITGGDGALLAAGIDPALHPELWPRMTLEGILFSVRSQEPAS